MEIEQIKTLVDPPDKVSGIEINQLGSEVEVKITQDHIDKGHRSEARMCPVAYALKDLGFRNVVVGCKRVGFGEPGEMLGFVLPQEAQKWIRNFDSEILESYPFSFVFSVHDLCDYVGM